jgi:hypothetical protein
MPRIDLTPEQRMVLVSWLYGPGSYLDYRPVGDITAREWLIANPTGNLVDWKNANVGAWEQVIDTPEGPVGRSIGQNDVEEMASIWWVVYEWDGNNIAPPNMPDEYPTWLTLYAAWKQSILDAYVRVPKESRQNIVPIWDENGQVIANWEQWYYLDVQVSFIDKASNP